MGTTTLNSPASSPGFSSYVLSIFFVSKRCFTRRHFVRLFEPGLLSSGLQQMPLLGISSEVERRNYGFRPPSIVQWSENLPNLRRYTSHSCSFRAAQVCSCLVRSVE